MHDCKCCKVANFYVLIGDNLCSKNNEQSYLSCFVSITYLLSMCTTKMRTCATALVNHNSAIRKKNTTVKINLYHLRFEASSELGEIFLRSSPFITEIANNSVCALHGAYRPTSTIYKNINNNIIKTVKLRCGTFSSPTAQHHHKNTASHPRKQFYSRRNLLLPIFILSCFGTKDLNSFHVN